MKTSTSNVRMWICIARVNRLYLSPVYSEARIFLVLSLQPFSVDVGYERFLGPEIFFHPEVRILIWKTTNFVPFWNHVTLLSNRPIAVILAAWAMQQQENPVMSFKSIDGNMSVKIVQIQQLFCYLDYSRQKSPCSESDVVTVLNGSYHYFSLSVL